MSATYFDTIAKSYVDVPCPDVDTLAFLQATEGLVGLFDILGSTAFSPVTTDMNGNIKKIRARYLAAPDKSATLETLVVNEQGEKKRTATEGLMWLIRGLKFTAIAIRQNLDNPKEELSESFTAAYGVTLKPYHSFVVKPLFTLAMKACPYRTVFYEKLGSPPERVETQLRAWLEALDKIVKHMEGFYETGGYNKGF